MFCPYAAYVHVIEDFHPFSQPLSRWFAGERVCEEIAVFEVEFAFDGGTARIFYTDLSLFVTVCFTCVLL